jgi:tight adherence protein C
MDARLLLVIGSTLLFVAIFAAGYALLSRVPNLGRRLGAEQPEEDRAKFDWLRYLRGSEKVLKPLGGIIPRSPEEMSRQDRRLVQAGIRRRDAAFILHGAKVALAVALVTGLVVSGYWATNPLLYTVLPIFLGAFLPDFWLSRRITLRKERIQEGLPDTMDLAVVCVEAGLGLDQSLLRIGKELETAYPDLSEELNLYGLEVNAGKKRTDAFRNLAKRTDVDDLKALVAVLIQTDRFGTSVAQSLRVFADSMRTKRRQRAEERAAKMNIKMIPPLVFFVFPAIWVVVLGPAMIAIVRYLIPGLSGK